MIIELATLPLEIQKYIAKVEQGESVSFAKNGELIAKIESLAKPVQSKHPTIPSTTILKNTR